MRVWAAPRVMAFLLVLPAGLFLGGCWNAREITDIIMVSGAAVDRAGEGRVTLTVVTDTPRRAGDGEAGEGPGRQPSGYSIHTAESDSVFGAARGLLRQIPRRPTWQHSDVLIIGEDLARQGIAPVVDWFDRDHEPRRLMWVLVADGRGSGILTGATSREEASPPHFIAGLMRTQRDVSVGYSASIHDVLTALGSKTTDATIGVVRLEMGPDGAMTPLLSGTAVFRGERMVGRLDENETRGLLFVKNRVRGGIIEVPWEGDGGQDIGLEILRAKAKTAVTRDGETPRIRVSIEVDATIGDLPVALDISNRDVVRRIESEASRVIVSQVSAAIRRCQNEFGADVFGFGETVRRRLPGLWRLTGDRWRDVFAAVEVGVEARVRIRRTGEVVRRVGTPT